MSTVEKENLPDTLNESHRKLREILEKADRGEVSIEYLHVRGGIVEVQPKKNGQTLERTFAVSGEQTAVFTFRETRDWWWMLEKE